MDDRRLLDLARAVSDGEHLDWDREAARSNDPEEQRLVSELRFLASVLDAHRSLPAADAGAREAPRRWGPLEIIDVAGRGSCGTVYRARDPVLDRVVALKLKPCTDEGAARAVAEGRMLARVHHRNVVTVHGADVHDGQVGIWMELVEGATLTEVIEERGSMGPREAVSLGVDLCSALAAVHAAGLVHGDLKSQNVVRETGGRFVLMDFGAGRDLTGRSAPGQPVSGTPLFMAPEVLRGQPQTIRSDVYALGVVLYHALTGHFPVEAGTLSELRAAHDRDARTLLRDARPDLPPLLVEVISKALAADPRVRYASAGEMEQALYATQAALRSRRTISRVAVLGIAAILLLAVVAIPLLVSRLRPSVEVATRVRSSLASAVATSLWRVGIAADEPLSHGMRVRPGDKLYVTLETEVPVYAYVVNLDREGRGYLLFPVPGAQWSNPLAAGARHRLPGEATWRYDSWEVSSPGGQESFLIVASRRPLDKLEAAIARLDPAAPDGPAPFGRETVDSLRGVGVLSHTEGTPVGADAATGVSKALSELVSSPLLREEVFVREIILENP